MNLKIGDNLESCGTRLEVVEVGAGNFGTTPLARISYPDYGGAVDPAWYSVDWLAMMGWRKVEKGA